MAIPSAILEKKTTSSTMEDARDALRAGYGHGTVCTALSQTHGRGRMPGRQWDDDGEGDLLFTLILSKNLYVPAFPPTQALALALCRRLETCYGLAPTIKWPNDVLIAGGKIAGILVEAEGDYFLAGMGLNLVRRIFSGNLRRPAMSLAASLDQLDGNRPPVPAPAEELAPLLAEIDAVIRTPVSINDISQRLDGLGRELTLRLGDPSRSDMLRGILNGLQSDGALEILTADGSVVPVYSGEIDS
jgi:BirA family transcriptional regulator, biotin operon repressor / biotin---[acetyl-CoA-carboxylase] ligase